MCLHPSTHACIHDYIPRYIVYIMTYSHTDIFTYALSHKYVVRNLHNHILTHVIACIHESGNSSTRSDSRRQAGSEGRGGARSGGGAKIRKL